MSACRMLLMPDQIPSRRYPSPRNRRDLFRKVRIAHGFLTVILLIRMNRVVAGRASMKLSIRVDTPGIR